MSFENSITLNDKKTFDACLRAAQPEISELTFTNLFMWRNFYRYVFDIIDGYLCVIADPVKGKPYALIPAGKGISRYSLPGIPESAAALSSDLSADYPKGTIAPATGFINAVEAVARYFKKKGWRLIFRKVDSFGAYLISGILGIKVSELPDDFNNLLQDMPVNTDLLKPQGPQGPRGMQDKSADVSGGNFDAKDGSTTGMPSTDAPGVYPDRDNSDYLYLTEDLMHLKGKKYDAKRNHINRFQKLYEYEYTTIDENNIGSCYDIMDEWCRKIGCDEHKSLYCEKLANSEVLENYSRLGISGALIKVNGKFEAFTAGEMLNRDTAVIHIEKANTDVHGLYTYINREFCERSWSDTRYINREQDLGVEGIRKAKLSYKPFRLTGKYSIYA